MTNTLPQVDVGIELLRMISEARSFAVVFRPVEAYDYFPYPLTFASFFTGQSEYEVPSDEVYCPCGLALPWDDRNLGTAVEIADEHIEQAHPDATAKARAKRRREAKR
jgi:hypothetical protein